MSTNNTALEIGVQFHLPTYADVRLPHLVHLAKQAVNRGVAQIWVTDNLRSRNTFVTLAALACESQVCLRQPGDSRSRLQPKGSV